MELMVPEKASLLEQLAKGGFNVPDFIYLSATDFKKESFAALESFMELHRESFKVIARSAHPMESFFKGGTFDSLETYADVAGIQYARKRMINFAETVNFLSIKRQQKFNDAPAIDPDEMGVIVMPFIEGSSVMAKMMWDHWEFGYCRDPSHKIQSEPTITRIPHDIKLLELSDNIQKYLGYPCEIEYIISVSGEIFVVQAKNISDIEILEKKESERTLKLDGIKRIRQIGNYRERPVYVMDNRLFYIKVIGQCEEMLDPDNDIGFEDVLAVIDHYEAELEEFAMTNQRFCVLGLSIQNTGELFQIANHYLDEIPDKQKQLSKALHNNLYKIDLFITEADTLISRNRLSIKICSHDAYGIDTVRNPIWMVYWNSEKHKETVKKFQKLGFKTGDTVGIEIDKDSKPAIYRI